jgi:hypothetical protein
MPPPNGNPGGLREGPISRNGSVLSLIGLIAIPTWPDMPGVTPIDGETEPPKFRPGVTVWPGAIDAPIFSDWIPKYGWIPQ